MTFQQNIAYCLDDGKVEQRKRIIDRFEQRKSRSVAGINPMHGRKYYAYIQCKN